MAAKLTIFTPAYNRADLLPRAFEALCVQENKDFIWLIIDDGSTDNTAQVVEAFQQQNAGFEIRYFHKENGGLHTAYNAAIALADTELSMCIDSDDWIAEGAVDRILKVWNAVKRIDCAGILALDAMPDGTPTWKQISPTPAMQALKKVTASIPVKAAVSSAVDGIRYGIGFMAPM